MPCAWQKEDYFSLLMASDKRAYSALEMLVDDLHAEKERTVATFLSHSGSEDFLWGLVRLLGSDTARVAGNAAYIIGTLAESELGCMRVLGLAKHSSSESRKVLPDLTRMLTFDDSESVMNAAGTMGTLAESHEGRDWILSEPCLPQTLEHITALLHSDNLWTASNAALVLARLSISEIGCVRMLDHEHSQHILSKLILSLGVDEAGRGMNAAFAIGRLCDMDQGRKRLLQLNDSERMISSLAKMLSCDDTGASKNACFALSCLATNIEGHSRLLSNIHSDDILKTLSTLLSAEDSETGWFAAMTLRTLASQPKGCLRLREHVQVVSSLKAVEAKPDVNADLKEEAMITLEILKRLPKPSTPSIEVVAHNTILAKWSPIVTKSGFQVRYQLFDGVKCVYTGKECECKVTGLQPNTPYIYKLRAYTEGDESPFSETVSITTEESVPGPPQSVRILGSTITQLKVGWDPPMETHGILKGYYVYVDNKETLHTTENSAIITGLTANTSYEISVCAATSKGKGERADTVGTSSEIGAHAPSKPQINVIGRNELFVSWYAPEVPLGRFNRYDVIMNGDIIYSGNDLNMPVRRLTPDTEYSFVIVALTSEGKFESKLSKKRTAKDEYDTARPPLYQTPKKESTEDGSKTPTNLASSQKRRKSSANRVPSAKIPSKRIGTGKERVKSSGAPAQDTRPTSANSSISAQESMGEVYQSERDIRESKGNEKENSVLVPKPSQSPLAGKPIAEIKPEQRPVSKTKFPRTLTKLDRNSNGNSAKAPNPVALSTVSMQNKHHTDEMNKPTETTSNGKKAGKVERDSTSGHRIERSKSNVSSKEYKKGKPSAPVAQNTRGGTEGVSDSVRHSLDQGRLIANDRINGGGSESRESVRVRLTESDLSRVNGNMTNSIDQSHGIKTGGASERSNKMRASHERNRNKDGYKTYKDQALPKPSPPSQKYLEGQTVSHPESPWGQRLTPRSQESRESDWLTQVKRVSESYIRGVNQPNITASSSDSTYFIEPSQFLQRTNTYINSHRRQKELQQSLIERSATYPSAFNSLPTLPSIRESSLSPHEEKRPPVSSSRKSKSSRKKRRRPMGRRSLEKLQKATNSTSMKMSAPVKMGQSLNFEVDIPDTSSKMANKFIPMQLRTQPANLGIGQLQRVNTTLLGEGTDNSAAFRRLEALTRSQTQIELKSHQSQQTAHEQLMAANKRELDMLSSVTKNKDRASQNRKTHSGPSQRVHKLGSSGSNQRMKEPDSMLLQQSWGINSSQDIGALQNVR